MGKPFLTPEEVNIRLKPRGITLIGPWRGTVAKNTFRCKNNHVWEAFGNSVLHHGKGCPNCSRHKRLTEEDIQARLEPRGITLVGLWQGTLAKNTFRCKNNHVWKAYGNNVLYLGQGCRACAGKKPYQQWTAEAVNAWLAPRGITLLDTWSKTHLPHRFQCRLGHTWEALGSNVVYTRAGCPVCYRLRRGKRPSTAP